MASKTDPTSPNSKIDDAINALLGRLSPKKKKGAKEGEEIEEEVPLDVAAKVVSTAIAWEKVKHGISDKTIPLDTDLI